MGVVRDATPGPAEAPEGGWQGGEEEHLEAREKRCPGRSNAQSAGPAQKICKVAGEGGCALLKCMTRIH